MKSGYRPLGELIKQVDGRNSNLVTTCLLGINIDKFFMPSVANVIGTDLSRYKLLRKGIFACNPMHVGRDERLPVSLYQEENPALVSPAYFMFEVLDKTILDEEYLMLWFRRAEFDRECWFYTDGSVRGGITWDAFCRMQIRVPDLEEQKKIVHAYKVIEDRINLKKRINENLEAISYTIFSRMFLDEEAPCTRSFTDVVQILGGGTPKTDITSFWGGTIPFFTPKDVSDSPFCIQTEQYLSEDGLNNCSTRLYPSLTTFITCRGTVGNLALAGLPMAMNQSCYALKGKGDYPPLFVFSFTKYVISTMKKKALGAVFDALVTRDFEIEKVFEPSHEDAIRYHEIVLPLFDTILKNTVEIKSLTELQEMLLTTMSNNN